MRKILDQKFWSHGTLLGSMGTQFSKPLPKIFRHIYFLVVLRVIKHPLVTDLMVDFLFTGLHWGHLWNLLINYHSMTPLSKIDIFLVHTNQILLICRSSEIRCVRRASKPQPRRHPTTAISTQLWTVAAAAEIDPGAAGHPVLLHRH